jgi:hypothetical protein
MACAVPYPSAGHRVCRRLLCTCRRRTASERTSPLNRARTSMHHAGVSRELGQLTIAEFATDGSGTNSPDARRLLGPEARCVWPDASSLRSETAEVTAGRSNMTPRWSLALRGGESDETPTAASVTAYDLADLIGRAPGWPRSPADYGDPSGRRERGGADSVVSMERVAMPLRSKNARSAGSLGGRVHPRQSIPSIRGSIASRRRSKSARYVSLVANRQAMSC